jgi:hypothetical protein
MHLTPNLKEKYMMARIMRRAKMHQQYFTLKQYGSWDAAEAAARKWVKSQLEILPPAEMNARNRMTSRNHSGVVGVYLSHHVVRRKHREYEYWRWTARWVGCPYSGGLTWSITTLGDDDAFALAVLGRRMETVDRDKVLKRLQEIYGTGAHEEIMKLKSQGI